jgi:hypothetical protein
MCDIDAVSLRERSLLPRWRKRETAHVAVASREVE